MKDPIRDIIKLFESRGCNIPRSFNAPDRFHCKFIINGDTYYIFSDEEIVNRKYGYIVGKPRPQTEYTYKYVILALQNDDSAWCIETTNLDYTELPNRISYVDKWNENVADISIHSYTESEYTPSHSNLTTLETFIFWEIHCENCYSTYTPQVTRTATKENIISVHASNGPHDNWVFKLYVIFDASKTSSDNKYMIFHISNGCGYDVYSTFTNEIPESISTDCEPKSVEWFMEYIKG